MNSLTNTSGAEAPDEIPIVLHLDIFSSGKCFLNELIQHVHIHYF